MNENSKFVNECVEYAHGITQDLYAAQNGQGDYESVIDYISENALDIEYTLDSKKQLIGVVIYVTLGGPTCYIDTRRHSVVCTWGTESGQMWLDDSICDEITDCCRWEMEF